MHNMSLSCYFEGCVYCVWVCVCVSVPHLPVELLLPVTLLSLPLSLQQDLVLPLSFFLLLSCSQRVSQDSDLAALQHDLLLHLLQLMTQTFASTQLSRVCSQLVHVAHKWVNLTCFQRPHTDSITMTFASMFIKSQHFLVKTELWLTVTKIHLLFGCRDIIRCHTLTATSFKTSIENGKKKRHLVRVRITSSSERRFATEWEF